MSRRYKPNSMELSAMRAVALSGIACIKCSSESVARYQQNRLNIIFNQVHMKDTVKIGRKLNIVFVWLLAKYNYARLNPYIMKGVTDINTFYKGGQAVPIRDYNTDSQAILEAFVSEDMPKIDVISGNMKLAALAKKQMLAGVISVEAYKQLLAKFGLME